LHGGWDNNRTCGIVWEGNRGFCGRSWSAGCRSSAWRRCVRSAARCVIAQSRRRSSASSRGSATSTASSTLPSAHGYLPNSLLNPVIYTVFNPDFRRAFRRILRLDAARADAAAAGGSRGAAAGGGGGPARSRGSGKVTAGHSSVEVLPVAAAVDRQWLREAATWREVTAKVDRRRWALDIQPSPSNHSRVENLWDPTPKYFEGPHHTKFMQRSLLAYGLLCHRLWLDGYVIAAAKNGQNHSIVQLFFSDILVTITKTKTKNDFL